MCLHCLSAAMQGSVWEQVLLHCLADPHKQHLLFIDKKRLRSRLSEPCYQDSMSGKLRAALAAKPFCKAEFLARLGLTFYM